VHYGYIAHDQIIKDTFKGTDARPADFSPVRLPLYSQRFNQSISDKNV